MSEVPDWLLPVRDGTADRRELEKWAPPDDASPSAVLVLFGEGKHLGDEPDGPYLLLTERAYELRRNPGQMSFPGGRIDPEDDGPIDAALREAWEETGVDRDGVEVLAELPAVWLPPANFSVTPVLAWWREPSPVRVVDPGEVRSVVRVPISALVDPERRVTVTHPIGYAAPGFLLDGEWDPDHDQPLLWGFTAMVVDALLEHLQLAKPWDAGREYPLPEWFIRIPEEDDA